MPHQLIRKGGLFLIPAFFPVKNENRFEEIHLVFDTGAALTILDPIITDSLGYSARADALHRSTLDGAAGKSVGYVMKVPMVRCFGFVLNDFEVACHDMNAKLGVSGILGMNFLRHFRIDVDFNTGRIFQIEKVIS